MVQDGTRHFRTEWIRKSVDELYDTIVAPIITPYLLDEEGRAHADRSEKKFRERIDELRSQPTTPATSSKILQLETNLNLLLCQKKLRLQTPQERAQNVYKFLVHSPGEKTRANYHRILFCRHLSWIINNMKYTRQLHPKREEMVRLTDDTQSFMTQVLEKITKTEEHPNDSFEPGDVILPWLYQSCVQLLNVMVFHDPDSVLHGSVVASLFSGQKLHQDEDVLCMRGRKFLLMLVMLVHLFELGNVELLDVPYISGYIVLKDSASNLPIVDCCEFGTQETSEIPTLSVTLKNEERIKTLLPSIIFANMMRSLGVVCRRKKVSRQIVRYSKVFGIIYQKLQSSGYLQPIPLDEVSRSRFVQMVTKSVTKNQRGTYQSRADLGYQTLKFSGEGLKLKGFSDITIFLGTEMPQVLDAVWTNSGTVYFGETVIIRPSTNVDKYEMLLSSGSSELVFTPDGILSDFSVGIMFFNLAQAIMNLPRKTRKKETVVHDHRRLLWFGLMALDLFVPDASAIILPRIKRKGQHSTTNYQNIMT